MNIRTCLRGLALIVLAACGGGSEEVEDQAAATAEAAVLSPVRAHAALPSGIDSSGWTVNAGISSTVPLRSGEVMVSPAEHQLLWIGDARNRLTLSAIREPEQDAVGIDPWTTALSFVALDPMLLPEYLADPAAFRDVAATLPEMKELAQRIDEKLRASSDADLRQATETARDALLRALQPSEKVTLSVLGEQSGLAVEKLQVRDNVLKLQITNSMSRWVHAYVEDGDQVLAEALVPPASFLTLIPFKLRKPSVTRTEPGVDLTAHPNARVRLYGPGGVVPADWGVEGHPERLLQPTVATVIDNFALPFLRIVTGIGSILQAHGPDSVKRKLWTEILRDQAFVAYFAGKVETGEWHRIAAGIAHRAIEMMLGNHEGLLERALKEAGIVVGAELLLKSVTVLAVPWLYPTYNLAQMASSAVNVVKAKIDYANALLRTDVVVRSAPPEIWANVSSTFGAAPLIVRFDTVSSRLIRRVEWDFGDGSAPESQPVATHVYHANGRYKAVLKVTDIDGATASKEFDIEVGILRAPTGLVAKAHALGWIRLTWSYPGDRPVSFKVLRSADGQTYSAVGGGYGTTFDDRALPSGSRFYYIVQAAYQGVTSAPTDVASAKTWTFLELPTDATWSNARIVSGRSELIPGAPWVWAVQPSDEYGAAVIETTFDLPSNAAIKGVSIEGSYPSYHRVWINGEMAGEYGSPGFPWIPEWEGYHVVSGHNVVRIGAAHPELWNDTHWREKPYGNPAFTAKIGIVYESP